MKYATKEWYINGCEINDEIKKWWEYYASNKSLFPDWYDDNFSLHDGKIIKTEKVSLADGTESFLMIITDDLNRNYAHSLNFQNYEIIESCELINSFCIADEMYIKKNGGIEFHLFLQNFENQEDKNDLYYFTISCEKIIYNHIKI